MGNTKCLHRLTLCPILGISFLFFLFSFLFSLSPLSASGSQDSGDQAKLNNEWVLGITSFDYSLIPPAHRIAGDVLTRNLFDKLRAVSYRLRVSHEYAYYESYAWQQSVNAAAKALSQKQDERSVMLYRGDPDWKYRNNLKKVDADIEKLQAEYLKKEAEKPLINNEPRFVLQENTTGTYPASPKPGSERRFCRDQKLDAFLSGEMREFHNRYYIRLRLFTLHANSYVYEEDIIFSLEDADGAVDEIAARLTAVLSGNKPAMVAVKANPPESQILINQSYAGRGSVEARERPPGTIIVAVAADGYNPQAAETELIAGTMTNVEVTLGPLHYADVHISVPDRTDASVYLGARYMGAAPYTLRLPIEQLNYIVVETKNEMAKAVFSSPDLPDKQFDISLTTKVPLPSGERRVNKARHLYYWAWGGTWITGIAAWIANGVYTAQNDALARGVYDPAFYDNTQAMYYISAGAVILVGAAVGYEIFRMWRYVRTATENVTPIVRQVR